jgi:ParB/RepB/Spo0J family partition protein
MATTVPASQPMSLELIHVPANVRELDSEHVDVLTRSIALQGILVPLVVCPSGDRFELVAGFHRIAAAARLGLTEVPVIVRAIETDAADRAVENIARKQLNPYEPSTIGSDATFGVSAGCDGAWQRGDVVSSAWCECAA